MKKFIIGALALVVIGVSGVFIKTQIADANTFIPKIDMSVKNDSATIKGYVGEEFEVGITIIPNDMEYKNTNPVTSNTIENVSLKVSPILGLNFKGAKINESFIKAMNNEVELDNIEYKNISTTSGWKTQASPFDIKLVFESRLNQEFKGVGEVTILYDENERKESPGQGKGSLDSANKPVIEIGTIDYSIGNITGKGIAGIEGSIADDTPKNIPLNRYFDMNYIVNPGNIVGTFGAIEGTENSERHLIYVIDKAAIDLVGGNDEIARDSIINSLNELKATNPNSNTSLIVYGEKADIIKVEEKENYSIEELINQIDLIEGTQKSGNLGDALRKANILANNSEKEASVIVVSGNNPNYYTQVSEGNSMKLTTNVEKDGFVVEDSEEAMGYVDEVIKNIVVENEKGIRWYGVSYDEVNVEKALNDAMRKVDGSMLEMTKPYTADFIEINTLAVSPFAIKGTITATAKNQSVEIHPDDKKKTINLNFLNTNGEFTAVQEDLVIRAKIINLNGKDEELGFDVADPSVIEVKLTVNYNGKDYEYIFNSKEQPNVVQPLVTWWVIPDIPYVAATGLYNGRTQLQKDTTKTALEDVQLVQAVSSQVLNELSDATLAVENTFGAGILIKTREGATSSNQISLAVRNLAGESIYDNLVKKPVMKVRKYNATTRMFEGAVTVGATETKGLEANTMYLVTIDHYIDGISDCQTIGGKFNIGINVHGADNAEGEFWGITVETVEKPEHF